MPYVALGLGLLLLVFGPMLYVRWTMARHGAERADFPGTGGELARHLLDEAGLHQVLVELTDQGDHYDPMDRVVRLGEAHLNGRSVTAIAVAAHEVGHAVQHRDGMPVFDLRMRMVRVLIPVQRTADVIFLVSGLAAIALHAPVVVLAQGVLLVAMMALSVLVHLVTLPVELDASWRRALPALASGYVGPADMQAARSVLRAAALTYVAQALMSLLDVARLARMFR